MRARARVRLQFTGGHDEQIIRLCMALLNSLDRTAMVMFSRDHICLRVDLLVINWRLWCGACMVCESADINVICPRKAGTVPSFLRTSLLVLGPPRL